MAQQLIKVPPTKNTLLKLKKQVKFLEEGHDLLERKRELLTRLVYERMAERPETLYGAGISSNYQGQGLKLAKQFRTD